MILLKTNLSKLTTCCYYMKYDFVKIGRKCVQVNKDLEINVQSDTFKITGGRI